MNVNVVVTVDQLLHLCAYAPQAGCYDQVKANMWKLLDEKTMGTPQGDTVVVKGGLNR